ncbi:hypothetical protein [Microbacterium abyssi]|uniref:hypothetical protein n=1 Tax=Microbacterium abyssi TaxID=2782166 RepID=UPI001888DD89|nr:hypothetical protein [Microbacterium sp. A18JL241]
MDLIDAFAVVGEVVSWIGLGIGIPLLVIAGMIALAEGRWDRADIAVIERADESIIRWFAGGDFHERPLAAREDAGDGWHRGFVSARNPGHARLNPPVLRRLFLTLGIVFTALGTAGFVLSMIPAFI